VTPPQSERSEFPYRSIGAARTGGRYQAPIPMDTGPACLEQCITWSIAIDPAQSFRLSGACGLYLKEAPDPEELWVLLDLAVIILGRFSAPKETSHPAGRLLTHSGPFDQLLRSVGWGRAAMCSRFRPPTNRKLTDRTFDVEFDPRHLREQIDVDASDSTSAKPNVGRH
jgi:hypothetical protein